MIPREVEYARPATVAEALRVLGEGDDARALAGGQSLVNVMKLRVASPDVLVDLIDIEDLRAIGFGPDGTLQLGAMVTYDALARSSEVDVARPILAEVASQIADVQVRNRGTVGGNVCSNDPTNHLPPLLVALGATMTIAGADGERTVGAEDFFYGVYLTAVGIGELLVRVSVPGRAPGQGDGWASVTIGKEGTCIANAAATVASSDGRISSARVVAGCVSAVPERLGALEEGLAGIEPTEAAVRAAAVGAAADLDPPDDVHATAEYRRHLTEVCAVRAVLQAAERARS
jgi:carbon-monoxide dehydrogenase medium subunit